MVKKKVKIDWVNHGVQFLVVIIGILIAFQLNQFSTRKQQKSTINSHIEYIIKETELNKKYLEFSLKEVESNSKKIDTLFLLLNQSENYEKINLLSFDLLNLGGSYFRYNAYQNLIETGDIRLIRDFKTKQSILNLYEYYKWVESLDEISRSLYMQDYYPYLKNNFDLVTGLQQDEEIYQSKIFKNVLGAYKKTNENRIQKYKDCLEEMDKFLNFINE